MRMQEETKADRSGAREERSQRTAESGKEKGGKKERARDCATTSYRRSSRTLTRKVLSRRARATGRRLRSSPSTNSRWNRRFWSLLSVEPSLLVPPLSETVVVGPCSRWNCR